ncbi:hypothetical protein [Ghiorsea bivora]|uniref:hypothetical protein n=1 Tax=Ghiorsea bivora TaxID=1485545 RepID=UPI00056E7B25|nr:hypothetical protein [Ghiorsea bivora]
MDLSYFYFLMPMQWFGLAIATLLFIAFYLVYRHRKSDAWLLKTALKAHTCESMKDAVLFDGVDSYLFADDVLLLQGKILIVKRDESQGYIFGASNIHEWTCVKNHVTGKFNNPLEKVGHFVTQVKQECGFGAVVGSVLFGSQATFPKGVPDGVLQMQMLADDLEKLQGDKQQHNAAKAAWDKLRQMVARDKSEVSVKST